MVDDPVRSLAGELAQTVEYSKDLTPLREFQWADFLRRRMKLKDVEKDFEGAAENAPKLANGKDADDLPGWCGPA
ncbi:MAG TPA: ParB-like protein [Rhodopila sp.]|jgi:hypothetical protein